jgi:hypothetical protein
MIRSGSYPTTSAQVTLKCGPKGHAATTAEVENFTNMEMTKIIRWSIENKIQFNEQKSHVMLISRRRKERKTIDIYLNNNRLEQVDKLKYLGIIIDSKFKFDKLSSGYLNLTNI